MSYMGMALAPTAPRPKAPAMAVATVMITLRTMPHTDFDFLSSLMMIDN